MASLEEIQTTSFTVTGKSVTGSVTFLPEPERRSRRYTIISVDDHIVEPPAMFEGRIAGKLVDRAPRVVEQDGNQLWLYDGELIPNVGFNAVAGRPVSEYSFEPARFDEMRRGAWDIDHRVRDMGLNGVFASVNFPSFLTGFTGQRVQLGHDPELGLAVVRAWNDFMLEEWAGRYADRIIPLQLPWLLDPDLAAVEIRRNATRGFKAVTFSECPDKLGLPSVYKDYWHPFLQACEETETVVCLHFGSSGTSPTASMDAPPDAICALFGFSIFSAVDWLYSKIPLLFPKIKICLAEGGVGWVTGLLDKLSHMEKYKEMFATWTSKEFTPADVFRRNFWVCALDDPLSTAAAVKAGMAERVVVESDYPHADSTWPDTQEVLERSLRELSELEVRRISWQNASELFRHPVPPAVRLDPNAY